MLYYQGNYSLHLPILSVFIFEFLYLLYHFSIFFRNKSKYSFERFPKLYRIFEESFEYALYKRYMNIIFNGNIGINKHIPNIDIEI